MSRICRSGFASLPRQNRLVPVGSRAEQYVVVRTHLSNTTSNTKRNISRRHASGGARPKLDASAVNESLGPYGLRRVDYSKPPPTWPRPPPPPSSKQKTERYFPFVLAAITVVGGIWIYFNQDEQVYEYWKKVETGNVPLDGLEDDDEDDDEDEDEWEERK